MASKKKETSESSGKKGYQPKATARHAKITQSKKDEIESLKERINTDKYLAKKYEAGRKKEIKALPKEDRAAAKDELKESIAKRKESEQRDKEKLRVLISEERAEKGQAEKVKKGKEPFDEEVWVEGGKKKKDKKESKDKEVPPADVPAEDPVADNEPAPDAPETAVPEKAPESKKKK